MKDKRYVALASAIRARENCAESGNTIWHDRWEERIQSIMHDTAPSGSGIDNGTELDFGKSTAERLVFYTSFHHMDDAGCYDGWTEHTITVRPSLQFGIAVSVSGRNRNDIKDYLAEIFRDWLMEEQEA